MMEKSLQNKLILVTGGNGFLALHMIKRLLESGSKVRTTVRSLKNTLKLSIIKSLSPQNNNNLEIREATLSKEDDWSSVVEGCDYVLHVASPLF